MVKLSERLPRLPNWATGADVHTYNELLDRVSFCGIRRAFNRIDAISEGGDVDNAATDRTEYWDIQFTQAMDAATRFHTVVVDRLDGLEDLIDELFTGTSATDPVKDLLSAGHGFQIASA